MESLRILRSMGALRKIGSVQHCSIQILDLADPIMRRNTQCNWLGGFNCWFVYTSPSYEFAHICLHWRDQCWQTPGLYPAKVSFPSKSSLVVPKSSINCSTPILSHWVCLKITMFYHVLPHMSQGKWSCSHFFCRHIGVSLSLLLDVAGLDSEWTPLRSIDSSLVGYAQRYAQRYALAI